MELQESIIIFILGIITGVVISKHIGGWAINSVAEMLKDQLSDLTNDSDNSITIKDNNDGITIEEDGVYYTSPHTGVKHKVRAK